jgi:predicted dehydrogenase
MVHENYRFRPHYVRVKHWLDDGRVGEIRHARMVVRGQSMIEVDGVLIHNLDALRALLGPLEVVASQVAKVNRALAGEDVAVVLMRGRGGLGVVLDGSISAPGYGPLPVDRLEIMGSKGTLIYDRDRLYMAGSDEPPELFDLAKNYQVCFSSAVREFVHGILNGNPFPTDRLDNLETLKLMESCYVSAGVKF